VFSYGSGKFEQRGVAALHIEDQVFPKKCGHLDDKQIISQSTNTL